LVDGALRGQQLRRRLDAERPTGFGQPAVGGATRQVEPPCRLTERQSLGEQVDESPLL